MTVVLDFNRYFMILHLLNAVKNVSSKPFVAQSSVVSLNVAWHYVVLAGPLNEQATHIFWPIIHAYHRGFSTQRFDLVETA